MGMHLANYFYLAVALSLLSLSIASLSMPAVAVGVLELPSSGAPNAVCVNGSRVYVFGFENSSGYPRLFAARLGLGGSVERVYIGGFGGFYNCVVYGDRVISVGVANSSSIAWLITVFDSQLNLLESVVEDLTPGVDVATHVFIANNRLIVAGAGDKYGNAFIRVEERDLRNLELLKVFNISIGKGKEYSYTLAPRGGVATLIYSINGDAKVLTLSSDLKVLDVWDLGKGVEVLDAKWINNCLYITSQNKVLRLCSSEPSKGFYVGGGHPVAVEAIGNGVATLALIPRYIDTCSAKLLLISKDLSTATEYTVSENALCIHYMKPIGFAGNMAIVAVSEKGSGWRVELLQLGTAKEVNVENSVIVIPLEPFIAIVVITALALSIAIDRLMDAKQRSDQSTNEHAEAEVVKGNLNDLLWDLMLYRYAAQRVVDALWELDRVSSRSQTHQMLYQMLRSYGFRAHVARNIYEYALALVKYACIHRLQKALDSYSHFVSLVFIVISFFEVIWRCGAGWAQAML